MSVDTNGPILGTERKETPPDQGEASEVNMSANHSAHPQFITIDRAAYSRVVHFLAKRARRAVRRSGFGHSSSQVAA